MIDLDGETAVVHAREQVAVVDATDPDAVGFFAEVSARSGSIDVVFNADGPGAMDYGNGWPITKQAVAEFTMRLKWSCARDSSWRRPRRAL